MLSRLFLLFFLLSIAGFAYQTKQEPQLRYNHIFDRLQHPLDTRVRYKIGYIDSRFGLSKEEVKQLCQQATNIWFLGTQRQWFVYDENAQLEVNFIYDERQHTTLALQKTTAHITTLSQQHQQRENDINRKRQQLELKLREIKQQEQQLKQQAERIQFSAKQPHLTSAQRDEVNAQIDHINRNYRALDAQAKQYNLELQRFNQSVRHHNQQAQQINNTIKNANHLFQPRAFHKGEFDGKNINIYEFTSHDDLRSVLAHEFGHALGLEHNDDPKALMYYLLKEQDIENLKLMPADIAMLQHR